MDAGRLLVRGRIRTMARPDDVSDWMLLEGETIARIAAGPVPVELGDVPSLDLADSCLLPALHDAHVHLLSTGLMETTVDLGGVGSMEELYATLRDAVSAFSGRLLRAHSFDPDLMADGRYPNASDLDAISTRVAIFVRRRDGHSSTGNTKALELLGVEAGAAGVDCVGGRPTGVLRGKAHSRASRRSSEMITDEERVRAFRSAARLAASRGVGTVHALVGATEPQDRDRDVELLVEAAPDLAIDVVVYPQTLDVDRVVDLGLPRIGGCILLDGSFSSGTAALDEPYADRDGRGELYFEDEELTRFMRRAHEKGLQIAVHALGERAISQAVRCYGAACGGSRDSRHRIEHCELPTEEHLSLMRENGLSACVQPTFEYLWGGEGGMYEKRLGLERSGRSNPLRTMLKSGVRLAGGSDSYVTPLDSLLGIHSAVNRPNVSERLSLFDAVALFTRAAAWFSFDEERGGTLEPGKEASFVVLGLDPFDAAPEAIKDIEVEALYLRGARVYPE